MHLLLLCGGSSNASHESELFCTIGRRGISSFFCESVITLIAVDAFVTWEPIQPAQS